jgi:hypothetical protein
MKDWLKDLLDRLSDACRGPAMGAGVFALMLTGCGITPNTPPAPSTPLAEYELTDYETGEV